ncbi:phosphogluconate dehydrogenase (NAD(+)-dependent, decarboxylating) [Variovorax sp. YR216]|uniref:phosphogluconate dehydrogenase (NAD(+)-dependent, decarboxylating) n=1 Tax=Variovorax sp. YR216 TaxID=1882828 RepID=UPI00089A98EE|nr:decarboxylating 6-phosphogluconate dehydrogenase [Variovorax sp. YR216]SEA94413.1 6-phosphogluconate dehydrogenase (decarboxylating) [Variovorax sp. YR216]
MQLGMIGLGRMGANMTSRLMRGGHDCVVHDNAASAIERLAAQGATGAVSLQEFARKLARPRAIWLMLPAAAVDTALSDLVPMLDAGDIVIDGGNSHYRDDIRRAATLRAAGLHYVDVGTSGGIAGFERGFCLMIGGEGDTVQHLSPLFATLAPGAGDALPTPGRTPGSGTADQGWLHCGPHGAGHFVKMVHNGIEYGIMAAYAEGLNILRSAGIGKVSRAVDAETSPLREPELYQYDMNLAEITELWRRGSVIGSWLLDLTAAALIADPGLEGFHGRVSDSGEGRWTVQAAIDEGVPVPVLSAAVFARFSSRGQADFSNRVLSALRHQFGGHAEKPQPPKAED